MGLFEAASAQAEAAFFATKITRRGNAATKKEIPRRGAKTAESFQIFAMRFSGRPIQTRKGG
jgi:hypothetical protein